VSAEMSLLSSFPFVMIVGGVLLIVTGRTNGETRLAYLVPGLMASVFYVLIWMFNGKRSHSLIGVLVMMCAWYVTRQKRPSWPILLLTAFAGSLVVAIAITWRMSGERERSVAEFVSF